MKLIIDIPEEQYNDIVKHLTDNDGNYAYSDFNLREIIRNGTPITELSDNIFANILLSEINKKGLAFEEVLLLIDNAPPVEPICSYLSDNEVKQPCLNSPCERPQGEWIPMSTDSRGYSESFKCSICGAYIYPRCLVKELDYNGCPYCGATMRKTHRSKPNE